MATYVDEVGEFLIDLSSPSTATGQWRRQQQQQKLLGTDANLTQSPEELLEIHGDIMEKEEMVQVLKSVCQQRKKQ